MITLENVTKIYSDNIKAVDNISLGIEHGETFVLIGTSGCGKTTTMKLINRLVKLTDGKITINGKDIHQIDSYSLRRSIGYVIQNVGLFPHFTIRRNVGVVPELLGWEKEKIDKRVDELLTMVGLEPEQFASRYPDALSGGQQQRVGVARALSADPDIILMDEPFGALDPITRETLQTEISSLWSELNKTIVFVTHDIFEAVRLGDRIGIMDNGKILQMGTPAEVVKHPQNEKVQSFFSQHRFQLELLTRKIKSLIKPAPDYLISIDDKTVKEKEIASAAEKIETDPTPVVNKEGKWYGFLTKNLSQCDEQEITDWIQDGRRETPTLLPTDSLIEAMDALKTSDFKMIPVLDSKEKLLGMIYYEKVTEEISNLLK